MTDTPCKRKPTVNIGTGMPQLALLDHWGVMLQEVFGEVAYHVGSSLYSKKWRDIDVRIVMEDDKYDALFGVCDRGEGHRHTRSEPFWSAMMTAFSLWGQKVTGLPIDFQIHRRSDVKQADWDKARNPLGIFVSNGPCPPWKRSVGKDED